MSTPVEFFWTCKDHAGGPGLGSAGWQLPHKQAQAGAAYQVSVPLAAVLAGLPGIRNARIVLPPGWST